MRGDVVRVHSKPRLAISCVLLLWGVVAAGTSEARAETAADDPGIELPPPPPARERWSEGLRVEWVGLRGSVGYPTMPDAVSSGPLCVAELRVFTLRWKHFYWEILRGTVAFTPSTRWAYPLYGTAIGFPYDLDDQGRHQLRLGVHITFIYIFPFMSGVQLHYLYRATRIVSVEVGVSTFGIFGVLATVGVALGSP